MPPVTLKMHVANMTSSRRGLCDPTINNCYRYIRPSHQGGVGSMPPPPVPAQGQVPPPDFGPNALVGVEGDGVRQGVVCQPCHTYDLSLPKKSQLPDTDGILVGRVYGNATPRIQSATDMAMLIHGHMCHRLHARKLASTGLKSRARLNARIKVKR